MFLGSAMLLIGGAASLAQDAPKFNPGDTVEAKSYFYNPPWHKARVVSLGRECQAPRPYKVVFIGEGAEDHGLTCVGADEIRALEVPQPPAAGNNPADQNNPQPPRDGAFKVGDRVDVYASYDKDKAQRGTIIETAGGQYKVHYDGCGAHFDAFVDRGDLHPAATISADAGEIKFLFGAWKMFTPSYPTTVVSGNTLYREYGTGAGAPPLRISADGTYVWYDEYGKPPVTGRWATDAKIEGAKYNTAFVDGVIIKDSQGGLWKVYRWKPEGDNQDRITARTMCSGQTVIGTRIR
jgi:hypothetical protein